ncbi:alpha/beta fold hydrolase [Pseudaestuariivita sp.]|uniref:alpha/beta fold hydrolase n=1 Tax=Pseudaestuariivita sp. TaxID=2211669 RepID=UPI0040580992
MSHGIAHREVGDGPQTLVCLHGIGADGRSFHHQMEAFDGWRVVTWDMPGYSGSELREAPTFESLSQRLAAFLEEFGTPVHLMGQSIGGMIALDHALRRPEQIASLVLVTTTPRFGGRDESFKDAFLKARLAPLEAGQTMAEMAKQAAPHLVGPRTDPAEIAFIAEVLADVPEETWRGILKCLVTFDRAAEVGEIAHPTLLIAGSEDRNAPAQTMAKMAQRIPGARFHTLEGAGHMPHQEQPEAFNALVRDFLQEVIS